MFFRRCNETAEFSPETLGLYVYCIRLQFLCLVPEYIIDHPHPSIDIDILNGRILGVFHLKESWEKVPGQVVLNCSKCNVQIVKSNLSNY